MSYALQMELSEQFKDQEMKVAGNGLKHAEILKSQFLQWCINARPPLPVKFRPRSKISVFVDLRAYKRID